MNYPPVQYPAGVMLTVIRRGVKNWEGDFVDGDGNPITPGSEPTHQIGPCDLKWLRNEEHYGGGAQSAGGGRDQEKVERVAQVTAPTGSDVLFTDGIKLPDNRVFDIDGDVAVAPNGFTGWTPGVRFKIAKVM